MKICWDNLEKVRYNPDTGRWYRISSVGGAGIYDYKEVCATCGEPFLASAKQKGIYCDRSCNPTNRGKTMPPETRKKLSESRKGRFAGEKSSFYGKRHTRETREKMKEAWKKRTTGRGAKHPQYGKRMSQETKKRISKANKGRLVAEKSPFWKGGVSPTYRDLPAYDTFAEQIDYAEEIRRNPDEPNLLQVRCAYCGKWFQPTRGAVKSRIGVLQGRGEGEARFYCSNSCKKECPIYKKVKYPEGYNIPAPTREVQAELRQMVFAIDNYICQRCGSTKSLHCHHITGTRQNPLESADTDNCITFCKKCHKWAHTQEGCKYLELQCQDGTLRS